MYASVKYNLRVFSVLFSINIKCILLLWTRHTSPVCISLRPPPVLSFPEHAIGSARGEGKKWLGGRFSRCARLKGGGRGELHRRKGNVLERRCQNGKKKGWKPNMTRKKNHCYTGRSTSTVMDAFTPYCWSNITFYFRNDHETAGCFTGAEMERWVSGRRRVFCCVIIDVYILCGVRIILQYPLMCYKWLLLLFLFFLCAYTTMNNCNPFQKRSSKNRVFTFTTI